MANHASAAVKIRSTSRHLIVDDSVMQCLEIRRPSRMMWKYASLASGCENPPLIASSVIFINRTYTRSTSDLLNRDALKWLDRNCSKRKCGAIRL